MSVISVSFHIFNVEYRIISRIVNDKSIYFFASGVFSVEQKCIPIAAATKVFETYRDCALYGYQHSHDFLKAYDPKILEDNRVYTAFTCKVSETI